MLQVRRAYCGTSTPDEMAKYVRLCMELADASVPFAVLDDRGGTGCFQIIVEIGRGTRLPNRYSKYFEKPEDAASQIAI